MITYIEIYPCSISDRVHYDHYEQCNQYFILKKDYFLESYSKSVSKIIMLDDEINLQELYYRGIPIEGERWNAFSLDGISLYPCFLIGWNRAIRGNYDIGNSDFKDTPEIFEAIKERSKIEKLDKSYFETLSKICGEEIFKGMVYCKYYYFLLGLKNGSEPAEYVVPIKQGLNNNSKFDRSNVTAHEILKLMSVVDTGGWQYFFKNEADFELFVSMMVDFFEGREYQIPSNKIEVVNRGKMKCARWLKLIHDSLRHRTLRNDNDFFQLVSYINRFSDQNLAYRAMIS